MSGALEHRLLEDRALRDAAYALVQADIANVRASLSERSIPSRVMDRIGEGASDVFDEAVEVADDHKGALATLLAAVVLWFARNPILSLFIDTDDEDEHDDEEREDSRSERQGNAVR